MSSLPKTQRSVQINEHGGLDVIKIVTDAPVPTPEDNQVLVKNAFAGLNFIDTVCPFFLPVSTLTSETTS